MSKDSSAVERYDAFISYSHVASGHVAQAIQNGLQHLAKPFYKLRAIRVFRDETDLSAATDLGNEIREALEKSRFFVLLASPDAAKSNWVRQEVQYWLENKDRERLLIVCTQGTITWREGNGQPGSGDFDWAQTNALPDNLMHAFEHEPHWVSLPHTTSKADLSRRNPLFMREVARIAAPIRGMELTELVNADRREHRRTLGLAWSAMIGLALLAAIALLLYVKATEANRESLSRLAENHWASAVRARGESDDLRASHEFARAANVYPDKADAAHSAFNSRVLLRSHLVSIFEHNAPLLGARFSPDGKRILTWDSSNMARLWKVADGALIAILPHGDPVQFGWMDAMFVDGGKRIVTVGSRNLRFWDGENGSPSQGADEKFAFSKTMLSSDGRALLAWADWRGVVQLLSVKDGRPLGPPLNTDFRVAFNRHSNIRILTDITERPDSDGHCPASLRCSALCAMEQILESDCVLQRSAKLIHLCSDKLRPSFQEYPAVQIHSQ